MTPAVNTEASAVGKAKGAPRSDQGLVRVEGGGQLGLRDAPHARVQGQQGRSGRGVLDAAPVSRLEQTAFWQSLAEMM